MDRCSRHASMYVVTTEACTSVGTAHILVSQYMIESRCLKHLLTDNGTAFAAEVSRAVYRLMGICTMAATSYHPNGNGGTKRVNHAMAQLLALVVNGRQSDYRTLKLRTVR